MRAVKLLGCGGVGFRRIVGEGPFDGCRVVVPGFRYLMEVVSHCVWLYRRFPLSFREVEEMMERGVVVSYETIRQRCGKVGQTYATGLRRHRPRPGDKWHLPPTTPQASRHATDRSVAPPTRAFDIALQRRAFPPTPAGC